MHTEHNAPQLRLAWLDACLRWSLTHRVFVLILAAILLVWGTKTLSQMDVDVLPDLTAPTVAVLTEAHGLDTTEVEKLVTMPLENALNGANGVRRLRSSTTAGFSIVWVEFDWDTDAYKARQIVTEKLQLASSQLPEQADKPVLAPMTSIMGEIMFVALQSPNHSALQLRDTAEQQLRRRLLAIPGIAQVIPIGGKLKQIDILLKPSQLLRRQLTPEDVVKALKQSNENHTGGLLITKHREYAIQGLGRLQTLEDIKSLPVSARGGTPIRLKHIAVVRLGAVFRRGVASYNGKPAVVLGIQKQPSVNTLTLTAQVDRTLTSIQRSLPKGMQIKRKGFRQANFINISIHNVQKAMVEGAILVVIILMFFLLNVRATLISALAIPFSVLTALLTLKALGITINTMSLGGITVAIGALVDDAVIDVENIFRRLRINAELPEEERLDTLQIVFEASREIRNSILFATLILMLVFLPLFFLTGMEGRLLRPLGMAYLVATFASLIVALTITPVLSYYLLARRPELFKERESPLVRILKRFYQPLLSWGMRSSWLVLIFAGTLTLATLFVLPFLGRSFLPPFNEGSLTLSVMTLPGTSLEKSAQLGQRVEKALHTLPEVVTTTRRTGRGELDEHAQGIFAAEIDVILKMKERSMASLLQDLRAKLAAVPGVRINIGQPISHRIDHMLSGSRSAIAIKLFGPKLTQLLTYGKKIQAAVTTIPGAVDVSIEPVVQVPRYQLLPRKHMTSRLGLSQSQLMEKVELALWGTVATHVLEGRRLVPVRVRYNVPTPSHKTQLAKLPIILNQHVMAPLTQFANIRYGYGPNRINRESGQRRIIISANSSKTDLIGLVNDIKKSVGKLNLPAGYYVEYGGQFEREASARNTLLWLGLAVLFGTFFLLRIVFQSTTAAGLVLVNLPLALIGGVLSIALTGDVLSIASIVGFIALFGIATRNGIIMVSHYQQLQQEGVPLQEAVVQGSLERLNPILMTALTTGLGMIPLLLAGGQPGNELQSPMALVILGGVFSATTLNLLVLPTLYFTINRTNGARS
ncbi:MAG: CusA/CzcA family heavy metal efflux RND transporter [Deltaproteobacteria bacterium]|nr:CusA/CzcA family heavy metal efflux RND transporter [Deltaproteobacteria bacterium]MBU50964.1 CusA/CzcA family heavy metal efflux RND transporter [Deltaproteobacteria bacterium]